MGTTSLGLGKTATQDPRSVRRRRPGQDRLGLGEFVVVGVDIDRWRFRQGRFTWQRNDGFQRLCLLLRENWVLDVILNTAVSSPRISGELVGQRVVGVDSAGVGGGGGVCVVVVEGGGFGKTTVENRVGGGRVGRRIGI